MASAMNPSTIAFLTAIVPRRGDNLASSGLALGAMGTGFGVGGLFAPAIGLTTVGEQAAFAAAGETSGLTASLIDGIAAGQAETEHRPRC